VSCVPHPRRHGLDHHITRPCDTPTPHECRLASPTANPCCAPHKPRVPQPCALQSPVPQLPMTSTSTSTLNTMRAAVHVGECVISHPTPPLTMPPAVPCHPQASPRHQPAHWFGVGSTWQCAPPPLPLHAQPCVPQLGTPQSHAPQLPTPQHPTTSTPALPSTPHHAVLHAGESCSATTSPTPPLTPPGPPTLPLHHSNTPPRPTAAPHRGEARVQEGEGESARGRIGMRGRVRV
jgi:hypothetical protein